MMYRAAIATCAGLLVLYACFYSLDTPLWTETIAEWIMARTPSWLALRLLSSLGGWAKPFAMTGALALLGFAVQIIAFFPPAILVIPALLGWIFGGSVIGQLVFWIPAAAVLWFLRARPAAPLVNTARRQALVMTSATAFVAAENFVRNRWASSTAPESITLDPAPPVVVDRSAFAPGLVRKVVTPLNEFYGMSKNGVDPVIDPARWRLQITCRGRVLSEWKYGDLLNLQRTGRFATLRCISNTLNSDLMGTAFWSGIYLKQILDTRTLPADVREIAFVGADGHGDSVLLEHAFSEDALLVLAMNGRTLNRDHGFPIRLLIPRYYGFKSIKWLTTIELRSTPYAGTWVKLGYTREPIVHTGCHIDRYVRNGNRLRIGGVAFAGVRGIQAVQVRADAGPWRPALIEDPLSRYTLVRWCAELIAPGATSVEARAQDHSGEWQQATERPLFPDGVAGPTKVHLT